MFVNIFTKTNKKEQKLARGWFERRNKDTVAPNAITVMMMGWSLQLPVLSCLSSSLYTLQYFPQQPVYSSAASILFNIFPSSQCIPHRIKFKASSKCSPCLDSHVSVRLLLILWEGSPISDCLRSDLMTQIHPTDIILPQIYPKCSRAIWVQICPKMLKGYLLQCFFVLCLFWRADGFTAEEDEQFEHFVRFALDLREKFFEAGGRQEKVFGSATLRQTRPKSRSSSRQRRQNRSGPGFYALPLPYLPQVKRCCCFSKFF